MKYVGKARVMSVRKFLCGNPLEILVKNEALATVSSSGATFFCNFSYLERKVNYEFQSYNPKFKLIKF